MVAGDRAQLLRREERAVGVWELPRNDMRPENLARQFYWFSLCI